MSTLQSTLKDRNFGLDLVRVISLVLILFQHCSFDYDVFNKSKVGAFAVEIFFVLSGFLIGGILFRDIAKNQPAFATLRTFIVRRWWRILPLYYVILFVAVFNSPEVPLKDVAYYAFFVQGFHMHDNFFVHSWTLAVEEWFYLAAPVFVIVVCSRATDTKKIIAAFFIFMLVSVLLRLGYVLTRENSAGTYWIMKAIPVFRFDSLFCGVFVAYLHYVRHPWFKWMERRSVFLFAVLVCILYVLLLQFGAQSSFRKLLVTTLPVVGFLILSAAIAVTLPRSMHLKTPGQTRAGRLVYRFITYSSVMAYAIYLIHPFFYEWISVKDGLGLRLIETIAAVVKSKTIAYAIFFTMRLIIIYAAAYIIYRFFEKPVLRLRDRLTGVSGVSLPG